MNTYLLLFFAIILEVCGTMLLPASQNFTKIAPTIILMTAYAELTRKEALEMGAIELFNKPFDLEEIEKKVNEA